MQVDEKQGSDYHRVIRLNLDPNSRIAVEREMTMAKQTGKQKKNVETVAESFYRFFRYLLDLCICIYLLLILAVMPFYHQEGYAHIGTDKATFFRYCILYGSRLVIPILLILAVMGMVVWVQKNGFPFQNGITFKEMGKVFKNQFCTTDWFAIAFAISAILSYLCSDYRDEAKWGATGWFMGLIPQLSSVAVYFLVSRAWKGRRWMVALILPVSATVFLLGYLNRFGIYPINMGMELPSFISTIGNINWYCGYLVTVFFGGMFFLWKADRKLEDKKNIWKLFLLISYVLVGFATLVTQGSNSGIFTMVVIFILFFILSAPNSRQMRMFWLEMTLFSIVCVTTYILRVAGVLVSTMQDRMIDLFTLSVAPLIMTVVSVLFLVWVDRSSRKGCYSGKFFCFLARMTVGFFGAALAIFIILITVNTAIGGVITKMLPASLEPVLTFSAKWGSNRGATWTAAWMSFWEQDFLHKLVGAGPDCMAAFIYNAGSETLLSMVKECFGTARLTNAHNEWLTILVDMGLLGLVSFAGMICTAIKRFMMHAKKDSAEGNTAQGNTAVIIGACGVCLLAYTLNNMFSFQQSMSLATIFVILGIGENFMRENQRVAGNG